MSIKSVKRSNNRITKRDRFLKDSKSSAKPGLARLVIPFALLLIALGFFAFLAARNQETADSLPKIVQMTDVQAKATGDRITLPLNLVKKNQIVRFEFVGTTTIPLLAYVGPSGRITTGISYCEPCKSTRFHIDGDNLVCNTCGTIWTLEAHKGISGGCMDYPPHIITNSINNGDLVINQSLVDSWEPRV